jgi:hypothetical protein
MTAAISISSGAGGFPITLSGLSDFSDTANFQIQVPDAVMATSLSGLLPVTSVPEPSIALLVLVALVLLCKRCLSRRLPRLV